MKSSKKIFFFFTFIIVSSTLIIENSHAQWIQQHSGVSSYLRDIEFINDQTGWVCGDGGTILKTTNAGTNWIIQDAGVPGKPLLSIHPVNENVVYCVGLFETIVKTTNGGANWIVIENAPLGEGSSYHSCFFISESTGWISSTGQIVKKTTDGGNSFTNYSNVVIIRDMYFKDHLSGIGVSEVSYISNTSNGGEIWSSYSIAGVGNIYRISILENYMTGFVVAFGTRIVYKTTDFGVKWDSVGLVPSQTVISSAFSSENIGWAGTNRNIGNAQLFKTMNGGRDWIPQNISNTNIYNDIFAFNDSLVWTCGGFGTIFHTRNGGDTTVSISQISTIVPEEFQLNQNFPNPFNPLTTITFSLPHSGRVHLNIYNALGQLVSTPVSEDKQPGTYSVTFDASDLPSGVYYYKIDIDHSGETGNYSQTRKMILLK